jgi:hypothetical protein
LSALIRAFITKNANDFAAIERESEAKWLDFNQPHFLSEQMVQEERREAVFICIVPTNIAGLIEMLKFTLNADPTFVEVELDLPPSEADLLKFGADEKLKLWSFRERVHPRPIVNFDSEGNVRFPQHSRHSGN